MIFVFSSFAGQKTLGRGRSVEDVLLFWVFPIEVLRSFLDQEGETAVVFGFEDQELEDFNEWLGSIKDHYKYGVYVVSGNHDWMGYLKQVRDTGQHAY